MERRAVDNKVEVVRWYYMQRAEKLNIKYTNDIRTHPFTNTLKVRFYLGGVHPVVFEVFGETDKTTQTLIKNVRNTQQHVVRTLTTHQWTQKGDGGCSR